MLSERYSDGKKCSCCGVVKQFGEFYTQRKGSGIYLHPQCRECTRGKRKKNYCPNKRREERLKAEYGISLDDFNNMWISQGGLCAICEDVLLSNPGGGAVQHVVDHNHDTGEVRGILCGKCNSGLGYFRDNPETLEKAISYLYERGHYGRASVRCEEASLH